MADGDGQQGTQSVVCAVCSTTYEDAPGAHRIRRCPACGSRLIRQSDGRLGAVETAAPPPKAARGRVRRVNTGDRGVMTTAAGVLLLLIGAALFVSVLEWFLDLMDGRFGFRAMPALRLVGSLAAFAGGVFLLFSAHVRVITTKRKPGHPCFACDYPLPARHVGRCPECGMLQNRNDPRNGICPGCRRSLRGFYGDACPECGTDVRLVTDGTPPDEPPTE